ncbi:PREDICTED: ATP synthase mitochondrial F1 complex assembly factor 2-like [Rhagoletis zephyria]|uniref:ATP synthase mitochondrial F1 complex assembly factor 2-like n=1 Tax=Rhagoletis zephyria TaxID=28612 RepID=UPI0008112BA5|nr:PREDICTED: ATP synthase mitochondrial F1 complex assembly factor 2-like [Rhagoletis zephyria]XP_017490273.1 PREDICTED: ATP synthase mitochondrial F1 complex assembly factor 2-like [Rhagoletis zephyria]XP_036321274.1 ATP synthase mitochondrial F1 complex assembly factor 2 [Rhagoletis pomonella]
MSNLFRALQRPLATFLSASQQVTKRCYAAPLKRFYKQTSVLYNDGKYEVTLDNRKLKTPNGKLFTVKSEPLAIAVATEFDAQKEHIERSKMHLSALCFTAIDNPNRHTKTDMVNYLLNYIATDTVLFQYDDEKDLHDLQRNEWDPIIKWFNERYGTNLEKTMVISPPSISADDKMNVSKYLLSHSEDVLFGFIFAVDTLKSVVLAFAAIDQRISVDKAVSLARLEEEYQLKFWGRVEWAHDLSQQELQARLAAAVLFVHLNRSEHFVKEKSIV